MGTCEIVTPSKHTADTMSPGLFPTFSMQQTLISSLGPSSFLNIAVGTISLIVPGHLSYLNIAVFNSEKEKSAGKGPMIHVHRDEPTLTPHPIELSQSIERHSAFKLLINSQHISKQCPAVLGFSEYIWNLICLSSEIPLQQTAKEC